MGYSQEAVSLPKPTRTKKTADDAVRSSALSVQDIILTHPCGLIEPQQACT